MFGLMLRPSQEHGGTGKRYPLRNRGEGEKEKKKGEDSLQLYTLIGGEKGKGKKRLSSPPMRSLSRSTEKKERGGGSPSFLSLRSEASSR